MNLQGINHRASSSIAIVSSGRPKKPHQGQINPIALTIFARKEYINLTKSLDSYELKLICNTPSFFHKDNQIMKTPLFDQYSMAMIELLDNNNKQLHACLKVIFNDRFSTLQLVKHLHNLLLYIKLLQCKEIIPLPIHRQNRNFDPLKIVTTQLSLLDYKTLLSASRYSEGSLDENFFNDLWLSLEIAHETKELTDFQALVERQRNYKAIQERKIQGFFNSLGSGMKNMLIADEILSENPPSNIFEAGSVLSAQLSQIQVPLAATSTLSIAFGPFAFIGLAAPVVTSLISTIYRKLIAKAPLQVYPLSDSRKMNYSSSKAIIGREDIISTILKTWKINKHPLLIGKSGVGKSAIMEELARRIAQGVIPEFKNKVVFWGSASQISSPAMMGIPPFQRVVNTILPYKEDVILALDEISAIFKSQDTTLSIYARDVFDNKPGSIRYGLFATTIEEYEKYILTDKNLSRRFEAIEIEPLKRDDMLNLLHKEVKHLSPVTSVTPDAMRVIYDHARGQAVESNKLLHHIVTQAEMMNHFHPSYLQRTVKKSEIDRVKTYLEEPKNTSAEKKEYLRQIEKLKKELCVIEDVYQQEKKVREKFDDFQEELIVISHILLTQSKRVYQLLKSHGDVDIETFQNPEFYEKHEKVLKSFLFLKCFQQPNLAFFINEFAKHFRLVSRVDREFVLQQVAHNKVTRPKLPNPSSLAGHQLIALDPSLQLDKVPFQHHSKKQLPPVPKNGILIGLPNLGKTCWLNATLKFIASTDYYDQLLKKDPPNGKERLHGFLGDLISSLRRGEEISREVYLAFREEIIKVFPSFIRGWEHDAPEFLTKLTGALEWIPVTHLSEEQRDLINKSEKYPRLAEEYVLDSEVGDLPPALPKGWGRNVTHENFTSVIIVDAPQESTIIDLSLQIERIGHQFYKPTHLEKAKIPAKQEQEKKEEIKENEEKKEERVDVAKSEENLYWLSRKRFTSLPDTMIIYLKRFYEDGGVERRIEAPIKFEKENDSHFISFKKFEVKEEVVDGFVQTKLVFKEKCRYRIGAAICHLGGSSTESGHYVCDERSSINDHLIRHNDEELERIDENEFAKLGYLLRLEKVINSDPPQPNQQKLENKNEEKATK